MSPYYSFATYALTRGKNTKITDMTRSAEQMKRDVVGIRQGITFKHDKSLSDCMLS